MGNEPLFIQQVKRVRSAFTSGAVVVATTTDAGDDIIAKLCRDNSIECFRGHPSDLLDRHYKAALEYNASVVIKIPSDCPLIDPDIINKVIGFYLNHQYEYDFVSNLHPASWPDGNDVEVIPFDVLQEAWKHADKSFEKEHTTPYIWDNPSQFRIGNVLMEESIDYSITHRFTIDYPEDYQFIKAVFDELSAGKPMFSCRDIIELLQRRLDIFSINQKYAGINWYRHHINELKTIEPSQFKNSGALL